MAKLVCPECGGELEAVGMLYRCTKCNWVGHPSKAVEEPSEGPKALPQKPPQEQTKPCIMCGSQIPISARKCRFCGEKQEEPEKLGKPNFFKQHLTSLIIGVIATILVILGSIYFSALIPDWNLYILIISIPLIWVLCSYIDNYPKTLRRLSIVALLVSCGLLVTTKTDFAEYLHLEKLDPRKYPSYLREVDRIITCVFTTGDFESCIRPKKEGPEVIKADYKPLQIKLGGKDEDPITPDLERVNEMGEAYKLKVTVTNKNDDSVFITGVETKCSNKRGIETTANYYTSPSEIKPNEYETFTLYFTELPSCQKLLWFYVNVSAIYSGSGTSFYKITPEEGSNIFYPAKASSGPLRVYVYTDSPVISTQKPKFVCCSQGLKNDKEEFAWVDGEICNLPDKQPTDPEKCKSSCNDICQKHTKNDGKFEDNVCICDKVKFDVIIHIENEANGIGRLGKVHIIQTFKNLPEETFDINCSGEYDPNPKDCPDGEKGNCLELTLEDPVITKKEVREITCNGVINPDIELDREEEDLISVSVDYTYEEEYSDDIAAKNCKGIEATTTTTPTTIPTGKGDIESCPNPEINSYKDKYNTYRNVIYSAISSEGLGRFTDGDDNAARLVAAIITQESKWDQSQCSGASGDCGLMQITTATAGSNCADLGGYDVIRAAADVNIKCGVRVLKNKLEFLEPLNNYDQENLIKLGLAAYNGGENTIKCAIQNVGDSKWESINDMNVLIPCITYKPDYASKKAKAEIIISYVDTYVYSYYQKWKDCETKHDINGLNIIDYPSPNHDSRGGQIIDTLVMHYTVGDLQASLDWLTNPSSQVSAHYVLDRDGTIYQLVDEGLSAWHAGYINPRSIGIEIVNWGFECPGKGRPCVNLEGKDWEVYPEEQIQALIKLSAEITRGNPGIKVDRNHIKGHEEIDSGKSDPGPAFPWNEVMTGIQNELS